MTPPYDLIVSSTDFVYGLHGLTRKNPKVGATQNLTFKSSAGLTGTLEGLPFPLPAVDEVLITTTVDGLVAAKMAGIPGDFRSDFVWSGPPARELDLVAVHLTKNADGTLAFHNAGTQEKVTVEAGGTSTGISMELSTPIETASTHLTSSLGAYGESVSSAIRDFYVLGARFTRQEGLEIGPRLADDIDVDFPIAGGSFIVTGRDTNGNVAVRNVKAVLEGTTELSLPETTMFRSIQPTDEATAVPSRPTFIWTPVEGVKSYWLIIMDSNTIRGFNLPVDATSFTFPDLQKIGAHLIPGTSYDWGVIAFMTSGIGEADSVVDGSGLGLSRYSLVEEMSMFQSAVLSFTTAP